MAVENYIQIKSMTLSAHSYDQLADELDERNPDHLLGNYPHVIIQYPFGPIDIVKEGKE